ncbi:MAG: ribosome-associated translation inhibitor RaiA [Patescibacteria group bacterium]|nr:ribosome-associated translation inhibitor RaiA [Patescibacteria group bacterium]
MNINIKTSGITLTPAITEYANKRLTKLEKLLGGDPSYMIDLELGKTSGHHQKGDIFRAEIHIVGKGKDLYAAEEDSDLYAAIDAMKDEIVREVRASKGKRLSLVRRSGARVKAMVKGLWPWGSKDVKI